MKSLMVYKKTTNLGFWPRVCMFFYRKQVTSLWITQINFHKMAHYTNSMYRTRM